MLGGFFWFVLVFFPFFAILFFLLLQRIVVNVLTETHFLPSWPT